MIREPFKLLILLVAIVLTEVTASSLPGGKIEKRTAGIPMRDGIVLSTDIYFPSDEEGPSPVILIRTPLNKDTFGSLAYFFAYHKYIVAIQDVRGRFASGGSWEPFINEAEDGFDAVEWLALQPWSNGKVGMIGGSYMASVQFLAARLNPPHLAAIIPYCVPADPFYNSPWENGIFLLAPEAWWVNLIESDLRDYNDPQAIRESQKVKDDTCLFTLPVSEIDEKIFGKVVPYWREWLRNNKQTSYWEKASYMDALKNIKIPVLLQSGWYDTHLIGTKHAWEALSVSGNKNIKIVIGPWNHANVIPRYPSTKNVGIEGNIDFMGLYLRWFDFWLKGKENGIVDEPPVRFYVMNDKKWINSETFPLVETSYIRLYLSSTSGANSLKGDGKLTWEHPSESKAYDTYIYDPGDPTPSFIYRNYQGRKKSDEITSHRNDILVFESEPLTSSVTLAGPVSAKIFASSSCKDTDWFVTLYAIDEKEAYMPLVHGCIRARFRNSISDPELLKRNKTYEYSIDMWQTAIKLDKGWKIRVEIASADFPQYSRNLNTGGNNETETGFIPAVQRIFYSGKKVSSILLPVIQDLK